MRRLPAINRVKPIAAGSQSGPFMSAEFVFENIVTPDWQKYGYRFVGDEQCEAFTCAVIERTPKDSGYPHQH